MVYSTCSWNGYGPKYSPSQRIISIEHFNCFYKENEKTNLSLRKFERKEIFCYTFVPFFFFFFLFAIFAAIRFMWWFTSWMRTTTLCFGTILFIAKAPCITTAKFFRYTSSWKCLIRKSNTRLLVVICFCWYEKKTKWWGM